MKDFFAVISAIGTLSLFLIGAFVLPAKVRVH